jgi:hypothetical protein
MLEMLVGGVAWWFIMAVWVVVLWFFVETEHGLLGLLSTAIYLALLQWGFHVDVLYWFVHHLGHIFVGIGFYAALGAAWAFWRWYLFAHEQLEPYFKMRSEWLSSKGQSNLDYIPEDLKEEWVKYLEEDKTYGYSNTPSRKSLCSTPKVMKYKTKIMRWIGYWPISVLSWIFNDMVRAMVKMVYTSIADRLQAIAHNVFAKVRKDLPEDFKYVD